MTPRRVTSPIVTTRVITPTLPGITPVMPERLHFFGSIVAVVVGLLSAVVSELPFAVARVGAWLLVASAIFAGAVLMSLVIEHLRFLMPGRPSPPPGAEILVPEPEMPGRPLWRGTTRGTVRRARFWADSESVGIISSLHREFRWERARVTALRMVRGPQGDLTFLEIIGQHGQVLGFLHWWDWFVDNCTDKLSEFARRADLKLSEVSWDRVRGSGGRSNDDSDGFGSSIAISRSTFLMGHAFGLALICLVCAVQAARTPDGPGVIGTAVGLAGVGAFLVLAVAVLTVVLWDQGRVRGGGRRSRRRPRAA